jgi:hypothetical protein
MAAGHCNQRLDLDRLDGSAHGESTLQRECQPGAMEFTLVTLTGSGARGSRAGWDVAPQSDAWSVAICRRAYVGRLRACALPRLR